MKLSALLAQLGQLSLQYGDIDVLHDLDTGDDVVAIRDVAFNSPLDAQTNGLPANTIILS